MGIITTVQAELLRAAAAMVTKKEFNHLLYIGDLPLPDDLVKAKSSARKKLVQAVTSEAQRQVIQALGIQTIALPTYDIARPERFKIALVGGVAKGVFKDDEVVVGMIGRGPTTYPDTLYVVTIGADDHASVDTGFGVVGSARLPAAILEALIDLAVDIGRDGWEGKPLGALIVVGDTAVVMEKSRQLTLNPFQGYSESEKNVLNPQVRTAIKNFAVLDGAFIVREDGVVLAAGRYIKFDEGTEFSVPLGLGARHTAAAGISMDSDALAIVVSETTRVVRVFQGGKSVLEIHPTQQRRSHTPLPEIAAALEAGDEAGEDPSDTVETIPPPSDPPKRRDGDKAKSKDSKRKEPKSKG